MISPEEDFDTWIAIILTTIEPKDEYVHFLPDLTRLLQEYSNHSVLPEPISDYSQNFVELTCPTIILKILSLDYLSSEELNKVKGTLKSIVYSSILGISNNHLKKMETFVYMILSYDSNLYKKNGVSWTVSTVSTVYMEIVNYFLAEGPIDILVEYIKKEPNLENFSFLAKIVKIIGYNFKTEEGVKLLENLHGSILPFFSQFNDSNTILRETDKVLLSEFIKFILKFLKPTEEYANLRKALLNFGDLCLRSDYIDKQIVGSDIIVRISEIDGQLFDLYAKETKLTDFLMGTYGLHIDIINRLSSVITKIFKDEELSEPIEKLTQLYHRAELSLISEKPTLYNFLANALKSSRKEIVSEFLKKITSEQNSENGKMGELMQFLLAFINNASTQRPEVVTHIIQFLLSLLSFNNEVFEANKESSNNIINQTNKEIIENKENIEISESKREKEYPKFKENKEIIDEAIIKLCEGSLLREGRVVIYEYVSSLICSKTNNKRIPTSSHKTTKKLVRAAIVLGEEVQNTILASCIANEELWLLKTILRHSNSSFLPPQGLTKLLMTKASNDFGGNNIDGWDILSKIIQKRGIAFLENSYIEITTILSEFDFKSATMTQFLVIKEFIIYNAVKTKKVEVYEQIQTLNSRIFKVYDPRINGSHMIYKFITYSENDEVSNAALIILLELYKNSPFSYFLLLANDSVKSLQEMEISDKNNHCTRYLQMINAFISTIEKNVDISRFGVRRHKMKGKNDITFTVKIHSGMSDEIFDLTCSPTILGSDLNKIVSSRLDLSNAYLVLMNGSIPIRYNEMISESGVVNGSIITLSAGGELKKLGEKIVTCFTKIVGTEEIVNKYYNILGNDSLDKNLLKAVWKFLMLMPSKTNIDLNSLKNAKTQMEIRYIIQSFNQNESIPNNPLLLNKVVNQIFDMLCSESIQLFAFFDSLDFVKDHMNFENEEKANKFALFLLKSLTKYSENKKLNSLLIEVLRLYTNRYKYFVTNNLCENKLLFNELILTLPKDLFNKIMSIFKMLTNHSDIFSMLLDLFDDIKNHSNKIYEYFSLLISIFDDSININDVNRSIDICVPFINIPGTPLFDNICLFLANVFKHHPELLRNHFSLSEPLSETFFYSTNTSTQEAILSLLDLFSAQSEDFRSKIRQALKDHFSIEIDRWCYDPSANTKSNTGFVGLRNMGATCYMNSVTQQLFFNLDFRHQVLKTRSDVDWQREFRSLFITLLKTKMLKADTSKFVSKWRFFDNEPVNPKMQQDAIEFLALLLDRMNDDLYKGELVNFMTAKDPKVDEFKTERLELFWTISLEVKGCKNFDESFQSFQQQEVVQGYFAESLAKKIDVLRFARIRRAPKYLIIQLKRFDYNVTTWKRIKINKKFVFPREFNLAPLTENPENAKINYILTGIVMHTGTVDGGHYQSYIKINKKWYNFNDSSVSEAKESKLLAEAYGESSNNNNMSNNNDDYYTESNASSAYLLFYEQLDNNDILFRDHAKNSNFENEELSCDYYESDLIDKDGYDRVLLDQIEAENADFVHMQSAFSTAMMNMILNINDDYEILFLYFLNVFAHSNHSQFALKFANHFVEVIHDLHKSDEVIALFDKHADRIAEIFVFCSDEDILQSIVLVVNFVLENSTSEHSKSFVVKIFNKIESLIQNWRCVHIFCDIVVSFAIKNIDFVVEQKWTSRFIKIIKTSLEGSKSSMYIQNINYSSFFYFFTSNLNLLSKEEINELCQLANLILQSPAQNEAFVSFLKRCSTKGDLDLNLFVDTLLSNIKESTTNVIISLLLQLSSFSKNSNAVSPSSENEVNNEGGIDAVVINKLLNSPRVSKHMIVERFLCDIKNERSRNDHVSSSPKSGSSVANVSLKDRLINSNPKILFFLITCDDPKACSTMEQLYLSLFPTILPLHHFSRAESALFPEKATIIKFTWKDTCHDEIPDYVKEDMFKLIHASIEGISELIVNQKKNSITCNDNECNNCGSINNPNNPNSHNNDQTKLNRKYTHFLRVFFWLVHRSKYVFSDEEEKVILDFYGFLKALNVDDNTNLVELVRVCQLLPNKSLIIYRFDNIIECVFGSKITQKLLAEFLFCVFFECFENILIHDQNLLAQTVTHKDFGSFFKMLSSSFNPPAFYIFGRIIVNSKFDISELLKENFDELVRNQSLMLLVALPFAKVFNESVLDERKFGIILSALFLQIVNINSMQKQKDMEISQFLRIILDYVHFSLFLNQNNINYSIISNSEVKNMYYNNDIKCFDTTKPNSNSGDNSLFSNIVDKINDDDEIYDGEFEVNWSHNKNNNNYYDDNVVSKISYDLDLFFDQLIRSEDHGSFRFRHVDEYSLSSSIGDVCRSITNMIFEDIKELLVRLVFDCVFLSAKIYKNAILALASFTDGQTLACKLALLSGDYFNDKNNDDKSFNNTISINSKDGNQNDKNDDDNQNKEMDVMAEIRLEVGVVLSKRDVILMKEELFNLLAKFVEIDGFEMHKDWLLSIVTDVCETCISNRMKNLIQCITAKAKNDEDLIKIAKNCEGNEEETLIVAEQILNAKPYLRESVIEAINLNGDNYSEIMSLCGEKYPILFSK